MARGQPMTDAAVQIVDTVVMRGDLAHLALFLWAAAASLLSGYTLRELSRSNRRFEDFVTAVARIDLMLREIDE